MDTKARKRKIKEESRKTNYKKIIQEYLGRIQYLTFEDDASEAQLEMVEDGLRMIIHKYKNNIINL